MSAIATGAIYIGVSERTMHQSLGLPSMSGVHFVPLPAQDRSIPESRSIIGLWRRKQDASAWVRELLPALPHLAWLHTDTVGVDRLPLRLLHDRGVVVTNARGAYAVPIAEWVLCVILMSSKRMPRFLAAANATVWASDVSPSDLANQTVLILGYGSVGKELARLCSNLGLRVICVRRTAVIDEVHPPGITVLSTQENWRDFLSASDFLVLAVPLTTETESLVNKDLLSQLRPGARLINVARARVLDEDAMIAALRAGTLTEAWLDVFAIEPLPPNDRLWREPNVHITPHKSAVGESNELSTRTVFQRELERFLRGELPINAVNLLQGY